MELKIFSLNIWRFNEWTARKDNIINIIKKEQPDILFFQEIVEHPDYEKGINQLEVINKELGFKKQIFAKSISLTDKKTGTQFDLGLGVLTNINIVRSENVFLKKQPEDKHFRNTLFLEMEKNNQHFNLVNVHFSNHRVFSLLHLNETLNIIRSRGIEPVISGDFNILDKSVVKTLGKNYIKSIELQDYISFPSKNETLDYFFLHKNKWISKEFKLSNEYLSDHKALIFKVKIL